MPRNVYFSQAVKSEQHLYEDLIIESLGIYGQDVYYIPRTIVNRDSVLNDDPASTFDDAYLMEMYIDNPEGFDGAGDLYSKFGLDIKDEATFIVSRRRWDDRVGVFHSAVENPRPTEGDLIFLPMTNSFFEISFVEDEQPFYQLSNLPVYKLQCSLYEYNDEDFETGIDAIEFSKKAEANGAGEILLTSMDKDGTKTGYDLELLNVITKSVSIPVIASGGAGNLEHLYEAIKTGGASAVLAASIFHYGEFTIKETKEYLKSKNVPVRL